MNRERQKAEVDRNYDAFVRRLADLLPEHRDQLALMKDGEIVGFFNTPKDALLSAHERFGDDVYSIQEVTNEPLDLGFWTAVALH